MIWTGIYRTGIYTFRVPTREDGGDADMCDGVPLHAHQGAPSGGAQHRPHQRGAATDGPTGARVASSAEAASSTAAVATSAAGPTMGHR